MADPTRAALEALAGAGVLARLDALEAAVAALQARAAGATRPAAATAHEAPSAPDESPAPSVPRRARAS